MRIITLFSLALFCLTSCISPPAFPDEPVITFDGLSKTSMNQGSLNQDSIIIFFSFTDGDGDIGVPANERTNDNKDLIVIDTRTGNVQDRFHVPFVPPKGTSNGIQGSGTIKLFTTCCIFPNQSPCSTDPLIPNNDIEYEIYLVDRAGNESNRIMTQNITLRCN